MPLWRQTRQAYSRPNTPLGGAIEIHGDQGGGTSGCIAVTNDVMDILWEYCPLGVPVTVGP